MAKTKKYWLITYVYSTNTGRPIYQSRVTEDSPARFAGITEHGIIYEREATKQEYDDYQAAQDERYERERGVIENWSHV